MAAAPNRLIHELVDQSRDRVIHVRAGQSLAAVLDHHGSPGRDLPVLSATRERHVTVAHMGRGIYAPEHHHLAVMPPLATHYGSSSSAQFASYTGSKVLANPSVNVGSRRKAVISDTTRMDKLTRIARKRQAASETQAQDTDTKLMRTVAVMKTKHAFVHAKDKPPTLPRVADPRAVKNTHMAFLEFKKDTSGGGRHLQSHEVVANQRTMNESSRIPLRFGDVVCLLSLVADVPVAIDRKGRAMTVSDSATGPHMAFTIVDFTNPSRRDDVLVGEDFWLRVDPHHLDIGPEDDILALVVETHYYLGCSGCVEDDDNESDELKGASSPLPPVLRRRRPGPAAKYRAQPKEDRFLKLAAMKASVPSAGYYGEDQATREYTIETNPSITRLAKWRFAVPHNQHLEHQQLDRSLVLNCASVCVLQGECPLEYDLRRRHAVVNASCFDRDDGDEFLPRNRHFKETCAWQIRLLCREETATHSTSTSGTALPVVKPSIQHNPQLLSEKQSLEWLQFHSTSVEARAKHLQEQRRFALNARKAFDKVALQSNSKVLQIEHHKQLHQLEYFKQRNKAVADGVLHSHVS